MGDYLLLNKESRFKIMEYMPQDKDIEKTALYFQNFSDGTRLKIVSCLAMCDMCVNDLSLILGINQTTISHQLKLLKSQEIVSYRRDGKILLYSLNAQKVNELMLLGVVNS